MLGQLDPEETIAAIASPPGHALRGIIRLSGPSAWPISLWTLGIDPPTRPPRRASIVQGAIALDGIHHRLPATLSLWRRPNSYTGQDVAEIHTLGSPPLLGLVLAGCLGRGARHAQPGEFTLRAFLAGRIDLTRAEAVLGVIDARSPAQLDAALAQLAGGLSGPIMALREHLLDRVALLEANLDFADEADVEDIGRAALAADLTAAAGELEALTDRLSRRDRSGDHPRVVLAGPPNAGKSRLFNALAGQDRAIVSPLAGTTRDYLTALCPCDGMMVEIVDTAGIEDPGSPIESQAQGLRQSQAETADLVLLCSSPDTSPHPASPPRRTVPVLKVQTKGDLGIPEERQPAIDVVTSAATGRGLDELRAAIASALRERDCEGDLPRSTAARCRDSLVGSSRALRAAAEALLLGRGEEIVAVELRQAIDELGKVVGAVVTEDILDRIFQKFCIGK